ncbi:hypothetical protein ACB094_11G175500 [Castanea mollissima]
MVATGKMYRLDTSRNLDDGVRKKLMDLLSQSFHRSRWLCCLEDWPKIAHVLNFSNVEWLGEELIYCFWKDQYTPTLLGIFFNPKSYWGTRHGQPKIGHTQELGEDESSSLKFSDTEQIGSTEQNQA